MKPIVVVSTLIVVFMSITLWFDQKKDVETSTKKEIVQVETKYQPVQFNASSKVDKMEKPDKSVIGPSTVKYTGNVQQVFVRTILTEPEKAMKNASTLWNYALTVKEFENMLASLYQNDYVLVSFQDVFDLKTLKQKVIEVPANKKPLLLSIDDVSYTSYKVKKGATDSLAAPHLVEKFIRNYPDFSINGAKGIIAISGPDNVFGIPLETAENKNQIISKAKELTSKGWIFASAGYAKLNPNTSSLSSFEKDLEKWDKVMSPLVGKTVIFSYVSGAKTTKQDSKLATLRKYGYTVVLSEQNTSSTRVLEGTLIVERRHLDGIALTKQSKKYEDLFDSQHIIDPIRKSIH